MNNTLRFVLTIFLYLAVIFLLITGCFLLSFPAGNVLIPDVFHYRFLNAVRLFLIILPCLVFSAELIGISWYFGHENQSVLTRFSRTMMNNLRLVLIAGTICTMLCFADREVFVPEITEKCENLVLKKQTYNDYMFLSRQYEEAEEYSYASFYAENARLLYPSSDECKSFIRHLELSIAEKSSRDSFNADSLKNSYADAGGLSAEKTDESPFEILKKARVAYDAKNYLNAHYYASLAETLCSREDQNLEEAKKLSAEAWNRLGSSRTADNKENETLFKRKKEAYTEYVNGNYLEAYYLFLDLKKEYPLDPDVELYFSSVEKTLMTKCFFSDETSDIDSLEKEGSLYFSIKNKYGGITIFYARNVFILENTSQMIQYLHDLEISEYNGNGRLLRSIKVPYAKMTAQEKNTFARDAEFNRVFEKNSRDARYVPFIFLESVGKDSRDEVKHIKPIYEYSDVSLRPEKEPGFYVLPMAFSDLILIRQAVSGAENMPLISLFKFAKKAEKFGFSGELFNCMLTRRYTYPFIFLSVFVILAFIAWKYRPVYKVIFRFSWIFLFLLYSFLGYLIQIVILYFENVTCFFFYSIMGVYGASFLILMSFIMLFVVCVLFLTGKDS